MNSVLDILLLSCGVLTQKIARPFITFSVTSILLTTHVFAQDSADRCAYETPDGMNTVAAGNAAEDWAAYFRNRQASVMDYVTAKGLENRGSLYKQLVRLERNIGPLDAEEFDKLDKRFADRQDTTDFRVPALLTMLYQYQNSPLMTAELQARIKNWLINWKYWPDEPGYDSASYTTENHMVLFLTAGLLAGQLFPDDVFTNSGQTGRELMAKSRSTLMRWFWMRAKTGYAEWHSNVYYEENIGPLVALVEFSNDPVIVQNAEAAANILLLDIALNSHDGVFGGSHGRTYPPNSAFPQTRDSTRGTAYLLFEQGPFHTNFKHLSVNQLLVAKKFVPAPAILKLGRKLQHRCHDDIPTTWTDKSRMGFSPEDSEYLGLTTDTKDYASHMFWWANGAYALPETVKGSIAMAGEYRLTGNRVLTQIIKAISPLSNLIRAVVRIPIVRDIARGTSLLTVNTYAHHKTSAYLGSAQDKHAGLPGAQQLMWSASVDGATPVFTSQPFLGGDDIFESSDVGRDFLGYFTGGASAPRIAQHNDVALILYNPAVSLFSWVSANAKTTHAFFPRERFDEYVRVDNWHFARSGDGYIGLYSFNDSVFTEEGKLAGLQIIAPGTKNLWIAEIGALDEDGSFSEFVDRVSTQAVTYAPSGDHGVAYQADFGEMEFSWKGDLQVSGSAEKISEYPRYDNPFVKQAWGETDFEVAVGGTVSSIEFNFDGFSLDDY